MRTPRFTLTVAALAALTLSACASGPAGTGLPDRAGATVPEQWQQASTPVASGAAPLALDEAWWKAFQDAELNALVDRVLAENLSLSASALKVRQARLRADLAEGDRWPTVAAKVSTQGAKLSLIHI